MQTLNTDGATLTAAYHAACNARLRRPVCKVFVKWDGANWSDESPNVKAVSGTMNLGRLDDAALIAKGDIGSATLEFRNRGKRYSRLATGGDTGLRAASLLSRRSGLRGVDVRVWIGFRFGAPVTREYAQVFRGVIFDWGEESAGKAFSLECRDMGHKYLQNRISTPLRKDYRLDEWINEVAGLAGIPTAEKVVDKALFTTSWAWAEDESAVEEMWRAATADGGWLWWDQQGIMRYANLLAWVNSASVRTITADDKSNLRTVPNPDLLATEVRGRWEPRRIGAAGTIFSLDERKTIQPLESVTFDAKFAQPVWSIVAPEVNKDYWVVSPGGMDMTESVDLTLSENRYAQRVAITVTNKHANLPVILSYLQLRGLKVTGGPSQEITVQATTSPLPYTHTRKLPGNILIQSDTHARALATFLAERNSRVHPTWEMVGVSGIPQLELGDRVTFYDSEVVAAERDGHVTGINWRFTPGGGFRQDISLLDREYLFPYSDYFVIGQTALGAGRVWY